MQFCFRDALLHCLGFRIPEASIRLAGNTSIRAIEEIA
jgi:hypothetical protein